MQKRGSIVRYWRNTTLSPSAHDPAKDNEADFQSRQLVGFIHLT